MKARGPGTAQRSATGALALLAILLASPAAAEETRPEFPVSEGGTYSFTFENDIFGGDDKNYTNGVRLDHVSPRNDLPVWARFARRNLRWLTDADEWYATYGLGQNIYTPADISRRNPDPDDRPYAGFAYGSIGIAADGAMITSFGKYDLAHFKVWTDRVEGAHSERELRDLLQTRPDSPALTLAPIESQP